MDVATMRRCQLGGITYDHVYRLHIDDYAPPGEKSGDEKKEPSSRESGDVSERKSKW